MYVRSPSVPINKGPVSALSLIAQSLEDGSVAIYDVTDDPRIQYPEEAKKEGIGSILSHTYSCGRRYNWGSKGVYI